MNQPKTVAEIEARIDALMAEFDKGRDVNAELLTLEAQRNALAPVKAILVDDRRIANL